MQQPIVYVCGCLFFGGGANVRGRTYLLASYTSISPFVSNRMIFCLPAFKAEMAGLLEQPWSTQSAEQLCSMIASRILPMKLKRTKLAVTNLCPTDFKQMNRCIDSSVI